MTVPTKTVGHQPTVSEAVLRDVVASIVPDTIDDLLDLAQVIL